MNKGRFREFYQCDIDIINKGQLSYLAEAEIPSVIYRVFTALGIGAFRIRINNRKVLKGLLHCFAVPEAKAAEVLRILDKADKVPQAVLLKDLEAEGVPASSARALHELVARCKGTAQTFSALSEFRNRSELLDAGVSELTKIVEAIRHFGVPDTAFAVDLGVVRGLDYYTGTIYETALLDHPELGSVCSGGRYDDLASYFSNTSMPGVGISIGLTRLFAALKGADAAKGLGRTPAEVFVAAMDPQYLQKYLDIARRLREAGINTEVYLEEGKIRKQLEYADKKGFRVALIAGEDEFRRGVLQVKDLGKKSASEHPLDDFIPAVKRAIT
jgi:histidyl-tRNA synthetase